LRVRLTAASTAVIVVGIALASVLLVLRVHATLLNALDGTLRQGAVDVAAQYQQGQLAALRSTGADSTILVQVVAPDKRVLASSANIDGEPALFTFAAPANGTASIQNVNGAGLGDPGKFRVAAIQGRSGSGLATVYTAQSTSDITRGTNQLIAALLVGGPILSILLVAVAWLLVGRALRPVEAMRREVDAITGSDVQHRLPVGPAHDELQRLAGTFNALLSRIEDRSAQQQRFLADAAHELRNPVASLHARLDVGTSHPQLALAATERSQLAADASRLASLVDSLLSLARLDARRGLRHDPVDIDDLVFDHAQRVRTDAGPQIDLSRVSGGQVIGDRPALDRVVANLLDNAVRHAATRVSVELVDDGDAVRLTVADDGPGIPELERDRVFERFVRLDNTAAADRGGAGLGLAIVGDVVGAHQGTVRIDDNHPGARLVVTLPKHQDRTGDPSPRP
jgi:signal transduction histidine kinase